VPVEIVGEVDLVSQGLSFVQQSTYEVEIECLPKEIPDTIKLDITGMVDGDSKQAGDIALGSGMVLRGSEKTIIASIESKTRKADEETEVTEEEAAAAVATPVAE
jgi:large subunit ribosomal protein L25